MAGKYRDFDGQFAMLDVGFVLQDQRLDNLTDAQKWLYICLWCYAVQQRRETVVVLNVARTLARVSRLDPRTIPAALAKLQHLCLIEYDGENTITVCGVMKKHPNLKWKDKGINENITSKSTPKRKRKSKRNKEKEKEQEKEKEILSPDGDQRARKIPDTEHGRLIEYWMQLHMNRFGVAYDFKGSQDGPIIKRILKKYGYDKCCQLMETFLNTDDEFYRKAGYTLGVLSSQTNKLVQRPILLNDPLSKFSERSRKNIKVAQEWLMSGKEITE